MPEVTPLGLVYKHDDPPPDEEALVDILASSGYIKRYVAWASSQTDAPRLFHVGSAVSAMGAVMGNRVRCWTWGKYIYPNIWICLLAPSGFYRKSTSISYVNDMISSKLPEIKMLDDFSKEKLISHLGQRSDRLLVADEFGELLAKMNRDYMCCDQATECLTTTGWKGIDTLSEDDELIGLADCGPTTYLKAAPIKAIHRYEVQDEEMVSIEGKPLSMLVTKNHMVRLATQRQMVRADHLYNRAQILQVARWGAGAGRFGNGSSENDKRNRARAALLGWYLTEGTNENGYIRIAQKSHCVELVADLILSEWEWRELAPKSNDVRMFALSKEGEKWLNQQAPNKIPDFALLQKWSRQALQRLWDTMMLGDGSVRRPYLGIRKSGNSLAFTQNPGPVLDFYQALSLRLGYRTVCRGIVGSITRNRAFTLSSTTPAKVVTYTGRIWCPESDLGTFVARRNGTVFITGNSGTKEMLTSLFDLRDYKREIMKSTDEEKPIHAPAISILSASTLDWMGDRLTQGDLRGGFLSRFLFLPAVAKQPQKGVHIERSEAVWEDLATTLCQRAKLEGTVNLHGVEKKLNQWIGNFEEEVNDNPDPKLMGFFSRAGVYLIKLAIIFEAAEDKAAMVNGEMMIHDVAADKAIAFWDYLRGCIKDVMGKHLATTPDQRNQQAVLEALTRHKGTIARSALINDTRMDARRLDGVISTLTQAGLIQQGKSKTGKRGTPTTTYQLVRNRMIENLDDAPPPPEIPSTPAYEAWVAETSKSKSKSNGHSKDESPI